MTRDEQLRLLRGVLLADGTAICCFRRRVHETLTVVLERSGHTFTLVRADGTQTRHLAPTARSSDRALVLAALALRNRCLWHCNAPDASLLLPYVHRALWAPSTAEPLVRRPRRHGSDRSIALRARWPTGKLSAAKLFDPATRRFEVRSIEGNARVRLHPSGRLAEALYAVRAKCSVGGGGSDESGGEDSGGAHEYVATVRQTFSTRRVPPCFAYAVALLEHARDALDANETEFEASVDGEGGGALAYSQSLPGNAAFGARPTFAALATTHDVDGREDALALEDVLRVASRPTRKLYARVAAEVTEDATFFVCRQGADGQASVVVELADQAAVIECTGGFFRWFDDSGKLPQQFTIDTIPPPSFFQTPNSSTSVLALCTHAVELLRSQGSATSPPSGEDDTADRASDVVEVAETAHGRFRAFADGRVRAVFQDRTILQVDRERERCAFFFADGSAGHTTVAAASPAQQHYIHRTLEFADWAFASPRERMLRHVRRQLHDQVAGRELRRISVRFGMNRHLHGPATASEEETRDDDDDGSASDVPHYLTPPGLRQLQEATQQHIASVDSLLRAGGASRG